MQYNSTVCDLCNKQLEGIDRCAVIKEEYIIIKGSVTVEYIDEATQEQKWIYITPDRYASYTFCDTKCFAEWVANRKKMWHDGILTRTPYGLAAERRYPN